MNIYGVWPEKDDVERTGSMGSCFILLQIKGECKIRKERLLEIATGKETPQKKEGSAPAPRGTI